MGFLLSHTFFFFLSLYVKNWWSNLHSLAWTDGVIRNKILNSILKRIISAPVPCKQLSSRQQGKASKIQHPRTGLSEVKALPEHWQVHICSGSAGEGALAAAAHPGGHLHWARLENASWEKIQLLHLLNNLFLGNGALHLPLGLLLEALNPVAGDAQGTAV